MKQVKYLSLYMTITALLMLLALLLSCESKKGGPSEKEAKIRVEPEKQKPMVTVEIAEPETKPEEQMPALVPADRRPVESAVEGVKLALKFTPQDSSTYKVTTEARRTIKGEGSLSDNGTFKGGTSDNKVEITFTQQIQSTDNKGNAVAKITINELKYLAKVKDNITTDFDSSREKDLNSPLGKLIGQSYTIEITPAGQVSKIIDCYEAQAAVKGSSPANQAASMFVSPEAIKLRHTIPALPDTDKNQLRPGENWSKLKSFSFGMMGSKSYERIYTLKDVDNSRIATIEMNTIPSVEMTEELQQEQAIESFSKMFDNTEIYTGRLKFDLNDGKVREYFEKLQSEWVAVDPSAKPKDDSEPAALRMTANRFYHIEKIEK